MRTPASIAGHPIHPMLVAIPIGLWIFSLACDLIALAGAEGPWGTVALYAMVGGIVGALLAAIPGMIDLLSLPPAIRRIGLAHMTINLTVVGMYVANAWIRGAQEAGGLGSTPITLSVIAILLLLASGWLGGKMVYERGVGVHAGESAGEAGTSKSRRMPPAHA